MKKLFTLMSIHLLSGCAFLPTTNLYYDTVKSVSKDQVISQAACFAAVGEIAKNADNTVKMGAIALAEKCRNDSIKIQLHK